jgi:hypothetical protein
VVLLTLAAVYRGAYGDLVGRFFAFDDFAILEAADRIHVHGPSDLLQFLAPWPTFLHYRPFTSRGAFWTARALFGLDPVRWSVALLAVHVANAVLAYLVARRLLESRLAGLAVALVYASAPGHALAVRWFAFFTITGTVLAYLAGLCVWLYAPRRVRTPATLAMFAIALLCSEHAVTFFVAVTAVAALAQGRRDWRRIARDVGPFWALGALYLAAKTLYLFVLLPRRDPAAAAYARAAGYGLTFDPRLTLETLGRYLAAALAPLYAPGRSPEWYRTAGALALAIAVALAGAALAARRPARWLGVAAFGMVLFLAGLVQVIFLSDHVFLSYVGVAALGTALAVVAPLTAVRGGSVLALAVAATFTAVHLRSTSVTVRTETEFRTVEALGTLGIRWLATVDQAARSGAEEVVVPLDQITSRLFGIAQRLFLCASYDVRPVRDIHAVPARPGLVVVQRAVESSAPGGPEGWRAVVRDCAR